MPLIKHHLGYQGSIQEAKAEEIWKLDNQLSFVQKRKLKREVLIELALLVKAFTANKSKSTMLGSLVAPALS